MAYDEHLADRIRNALRRRRGIDEKKMFGGVGYLFDGSLLVGVWKNSLVVRVGPDHYDDALLQPHVQEFAITGRPMKGWVLVGPKGIADDQSLKDWIQQAVKFVGKLPKK